MACWILFELIVYAFLGVNKGRLKWWTILLMFAGVIGLWILAAWIRHDVMSWIAGGAWVVFCSVQMMSATIGAARTLQGMFGAHILILVESAY